jgi:hypothetical protein
VFTSIKWNFSDFTDPSLIQYCPKYGPPEPKLYAKHLSALAVAKHLSRLSLKSILLDAGTFKICLKP